MQTPRRWFASVNCNGVVYVIGGQSGKKNSTTLKAVEKYDSARNQWKYVSDINTATDVHTQQMYTRNRYKHSNRCNISDMNTARTHARCTHVLCAAKFMLYEE